MQELKNILKFMENFNVNKALLITQDKEGEEKINGKKIKFIPLWKWLLKKK